MITTTRNSNPMSRAIENAGFQWVGGEVYQRNGHLVRRLAGWMSVERSHRNGDTMRPGEDFLGRPGLWRWRGDGVGRGGAGEEWMAAGAAGEQGEQGAAGEPGVPAFELPRGIVDALSINDDEGDDGLAAPGESAVAQLVRWAEATCGGKTPVGWSAPATDELKRLAPPEAMAVTIAGVACTIELHREPGRLALRCPIVPAIPADLPLPRWQWLRLLVTQTQQTWRFVRVGIDESSLRLLAEVDLTGAPHELIPMLYPVTVDALRCVIGLVAKPAAVICDPRIASALLSVGPNVPA